MGALLNSSHRGRSRSAAPAGALTTGANPVRFPVTAAGVGARLESRPRHLTFLVHQAHRQCQLFKTMSSSTEGPPHVFASSTHRPRRRGGGLCAAPDHERQRRPADRYRHGANNTNDRCGQQPLRRGRRSEPRQGVRRQRRQRVRHQLGEQAADCHLRHRRLPRTERHRPGPQQHAALSHQQPEEQRHRHRHRDPPGSASDPGRLRRRRRGQSQHPAGTARLRGDQQARLPVAARSQWS